MGGRVVCLEFPDMTIGKTKRPQAAYGDYVFEEGITALTILSRLHGKAVAPDDVRRRCKPYRCA